MAFRRIGDLLVDYRLITEDQLKLALDLQRRRPAPIGKLLVELGFISSRTLLSTLAAQYGVRPWYLEDQPPTVAAMRAVPSSLCKSLAIVPVALHSDLLLLAMHNPSDIEAIESVRRVTNLRVEPVYADPDLLDDVLSRIVGPSANNDMDKFVDAALEHFESSRVDDKRDDLTEEETRPVVGLVNNLLAEAIRMGASDVHIEPRQGRVDVRYRVDGMMKKVGEIPGSLLPMLTTRLKIMAELDIVEYRVPQDGRVQATVDGREIDMRVSVLPNHYGQRIVLRILDKKRSLKSLPEIGFEGRNLSLFREMIKKPYGMFLVTGPTGSGKTTTLYAALKEVKAEHNNVMTCEDPIEYDLDGVNQSQVNEKVGLTFARQLRAILRQDPDVVLVGEIRDNETAETAMRAAMTGHLVLSTLHTNDALGAIPRLSDMGIDPALLSTSLLGVMSQRLVRTLCPHCKRRGRVKDGEKGLFEAFGINVDALYTSTGCKECSGTGFKGRRAVMELVSVNPEISEAIANREPVERLRQRAVSHGFISLQHDVLNVVASGATSLAEAQRVVLLDTEIGIAESATLRVA